MQNLPEHPNRTNPNSNIEQTREGGKTWETPKFLGFRPYLPRNPRNSPPPPTSTDGERRRRSLPAVSMDSDDPPLLGAAPCPCSCLCCGPSSVPSPAWRYSLKRKLDQLLTIAGEVPETEFARVEVENEAAALRETLASHQHSVQDLYTELEEERNASASAASEAMSMILRLQREKAEAMMEARQFRRFAEEKMAHDQHEMAALEDLLFKRDQALQSLSCEIQAYKHRLASYGISPIALGPVTEPQTPDSATGATPRSAFDYPQLRCNTSVRIDDNPSDLDKFPFGEIPREHPQLERTPRRSPCGVVGHSPRRAQHLQRPSVDSFGTFVVCEPLSEEINKWDEWRDDTSDRVYTIDAVHGVPAEDYASTPREFMRGVEDGEFKKLYMRLQALEADRESMRQAIISIGTDKTQTVLLREIAQQLCRGPAPEKKIVKKSSFIQRLSIMGVIQCIASFIFWRKKSGPCKYTFGMTSNNAGLLLLLEKSSRTGQRRLLSVSLL